MQKYVCDQCGKDINSIFDSISLKGIHIKYKDKKNRIIGVEKDDCGRYDFCCLSCFSEFFWANHIWGYNNASHSVLDKMFDKAEKGC